MHFPLTRYLECIVVSVASALSPLGMERLALNMSQFMLFMECDLCGNCVWQGLRVLSRNGRLITREFSH